MYNFQSKSVFSKCFQIYAGPHEPHQHSLTPLDVSTPRSRFEDHLFHGRVELLKKLYSGGRQVWSTQDDSVLSSFSSGTSSSDSTTSSMASSNGLYVLRRRGIYYYTWPKTFLDYRNYWNRSRPCIILNSFFPRLVLLKVNLKTIACGVKKIIANSL